MLTKVDLRTCPIDEISGREVWDSCETLISRVSLIERLTKELELSKKHIAIRMGVSYGTIAGTVRKIKQIFIAGGIDPSNEVEKDNRLVTLLATENPMRENTAAYKRFATLMQMCQLEPNVTVSDLLENGVTTADLRWYEGRNFITLEDNPSLVAKREKVREQQNILDELRPYFNAGLTIKETIEQSGRSRNTVQKYYTLLKKERRSNPNYDPSYDPNAMLVEENKPDIIEMTSDMLMGFLKVNPDYVLVAINPRQVGDDVVIAGVQLRRIDSLRK